jgi:hypothetical protein
VRANRLRKESRTESPSSGTFAKGASLKDPARLFNSSLEGNVRRAIDFHEGEKVDEKAFKALVLQAIALNSAAKSKRKKEAKS